MQIIKLFNTLRQDLKNEKIQNQPKKPLNEGKSDLYKRDLATL